MTDFVIDVEGLTKKFGEKTVVDGFSLQIPKGKIYGFLGPNGSGKTTSLRMLCGLLTPDAGSGTCLGYDIRTQADLLKRHIGYMTQKFSYWDDLTVQENLFFVADMFALTNRQARVSAMMERMDLTARADQLAGALSGGWKQRLALAASLLHEPELLLLDEPTAGVDPQARRDFWDQIHLLAAAGLTVLVTTHYMDEAERCHAIVYLAQGRVVTQGSVSQVIAHANLTTWAVRGPGLLARFAALKDEKAIISIAPFGETLHIIGQDPEEMEHVLAPYWEEPDLAWEKAEPTLEDAFIALLCVSKRPQEGARL